MVKRRITNIFLCLGIIFSSFAVSVSPVFAEDNSSDTSFDSEGYLRVYAYEYNGSYISDCYIKIPKGFLYKEFVIKSGSDYYLSYIYVATKDDWTNNISSLNIKDKTFPYSMTDPAHIYTFKYGESISKSDPCVPSSYKTTWRNKDIVYYSSYFLLNSAKFRLPKDIKFYENKGNFDDLTAFIIYLALADNSSGYEITRPILSSEWLSNWYFQSPSIAHVNNAFLHGYDTTGYYTYWNNYYGGSFSHSSGEVPEPSSTPLSNPTTSPTSAPTSNPSSTPIIVTPDYPDMPDDYARENTLQSIKTWLSDTYKDMTAKLQAWFNAVYNWFGNIQSDISKAASDIVDAIKNIPSAVSSGGKSIWDFLTAIVDAITHIADRIADGIADIIGGLFKGLEKIFVPSEDQLAELKTKVSDMKAQTGFFGQSVDVVKSVGQSVSSGLVKGDNTFKWSALALFGHDIIPAGSVNLDEYSNNLGFSTIHTLIKTFLSGIMVWNTVLFIYKKFRKVFKV